MLDGLLGRGFGSKCKSLIKPTKTRIDVLRKRAEAKQKFLKEDLAKLLANGLDINAYGRTEEFLAGLRLLSCYDFIEHSCDYVLKNLSIMQKQSVCLEQCREAVSSLMFAAARFSDLPELRDLRDAFQERYGNSIEYSVNKAFVDKLASKPAAMEKRLQLLQDIALEYSIKWDPRGFEQRMVNPSELVQDKHKKYGPFHVTTDKSKFSNGKETDLKADRHGVVSKERGNFVKDAHTMPNGKDDSVLRRAEVDKHFIGRQETTGNGNKPLMITGEGGAGNDTSYRGRQELNPEKHRSLNQKEDFVPTERSATSSHGKYVDVGYTKQNGTGNTIHKEERQNSLFCVNNERGASQQNIADLTKRVQEEEPDRLKSYYNSPRPPPYVKSKDNVIPPPYVRLKESNYEARTGSKHTGFDGDCSFVDPSLRNKANLAVNSRGVKKEKDDHPHYDEGFGRVNGHGHGCGKDKDPSFQNDIPLPKPRSTRRKHSRSLSNHYGNEKLEDGRTVKRSSITRRKERSRKDLQILFDDEHYKKDEEERNLDKLLLHYSKKSSAYDVTKSSKKSHADGGEFPHGRSQDGPDMGPTEIVLHPTRSVSLPCEQTAPSESTKIYARANSFQPDSQARHVHPKLPDYDDLAARFAALRGR